MYVAYAIRPWVISRHHWTICYKE